MPFEQIQTPTLIFQSTDDPREAVGGKHLAQRIPDSTLIGLTGGHFLLGHEIEIQQATDEFIDRYQPR